MHPLSRRRLCLLMPAALLAACRERPPPDVPDLTFRHLAPIRFDVLTLEVVDSYRPPARRPNVEHLFPLPPALAAERWAKDRLRAAGPSGLARFEILQGGVVEVPRGESDRYDAVLEVRLRLSSGDGKRTGEIAARAARSRTVDRDATLRERELAWSRITEGLMEDLNAELERQIARHLRGFLRS
jgi:hypothetical protein